MDSSLQKLFEQLEGLINIKIDDKKNKKLIPEYSESIAKSVYEHNILASWKDKSKLSVLDDCNYLEYYLLLHLTPERFSSEIFVKSVITMINHKLKKNVSFWDYFVDTKQESHFATLFDQVLKLKLDGLNPNEKLEYYQFLINVYQHLEISFIESASLKYLGEGLWKKLSPLFLKSLFLKYPRFLKFYRTNILNKKFDDSEVEFIFNQLDHFWKGVSQIEKKGDMAIEEDIKSEKFYSDEHVAYFEKFLEFLIDLLGQPSTRRHLRLVLLDQNFVIQCKLTKLYHTTQGELFKRLLDLLENFQNYEIDEEQETLLSEHMLTLLHYDKMAEFQNVMFKNFKDRFETSLVKSIGNIDSRKTLLEILDYITDEEILMVCISLNLSLPAEKEYEKRQNAFRKDVAYLDVAIEILLNHLTKKTKVIDVARNTPVYPTEALLWDQHAIPDDMHLGKKALPLPKLNLQFLSIEDYLIRNYNLFRLESAFEVKNDIEDSIKRVHAQFNDEGKFAGFKGWARMATEVKEFIVLEVQQPKIGEDYPAKIQAEVRYTTTTMHSQIKQEWENLKQHDIVFFVSFKLNPNVDPNDPKISFCDKFGIHFIRGAEVISHLDEDRNEITWQDFEEKIKPEGTSRYLELLIDPIQYKLDLEKISESQSEIYGNFHLMIRRRPKENNFKALLSTITDLMNSNSKVPKWLEEFLLGYGDFESEEYQKFKSASLPTKIDYVDTFLDQKHHTDVIKKNKNIPEEEKPEYTAPPKSTAEREWLNDWNLDIALPYHEESFKKFTVKRKENQIRFTTNQFEAIHHSLTHGLTLIEGPPGTGKTDLAVQILSLIYHNFPGQRTLVITHSNHALNDIFEKITNLDINERYLLRLGSGEKELKLAQRFSRYGRVNYMLERRIKLLEEVKKLSATLSVSIYHDFSCENAEIFFKYHVQSRWEEFENSILKKKSIAKNEVNDKFPFTEYLNECSLFRKKTDMKDEKASYFTGKDVENDAERARFYWQIIRNIFKELEECRAFELLRNNKERGNYLVSKQAKIIAMTCTHAGLKRADLIESGFDYDNVIIEEAGQILEIESFIPLVLQGNNTKLKRVVLIGDDNQLPPIIRNNVFQKYSNMEQSMFSRLIRLNLSYTGLKDQGRCRQSIMDLFSWRYQNLQCLPNVTDKKSEYGHANAGFHHDFQFVDVPDLNGKGETCPIPHYYQNLAEAEYVIATYMYMILLGYPAEKITILTTYNGQKMLLRDVFQQKCSWNQVFKRPKITTVDKYQGQQNDYILLSLVRTNTVGHLRDPRRLTVAFSRARLGLYVFGRYNLFKKCIELKDAFANFAETEGKLDLVTGEKYPTERKSESKDKKIKTRIMEDFQAMYKVVQELLEQKS